MASVVARCCDDTHSPDRSRLAGVRDRAMLAGTRIRSWSACHQAVACLVDSARATWRFGRAHELEPLPPAMAQLDAGSAPASRIMPGELPAA